MVATVTVAGLESSLMTNRLGYAREEGRVGERWCFVCQKLRWGETGTVTDKYPWRRVGCGILIPKVRRDIIQYLNVTLFVLS